MICSSVCYVIPENSSSQAFIESHTYDRLLDHIVSLNATFEDSFNFILGGDMNLHTSEC